MAALLIATTAAAAVPAAPAVVVPDDGGSIAAWLEGWLARLVPGWMVLAGSESLEPSAPPSDDGTAFDDTSSSETCDPNIPESCQGGETLPDLDPDG